MINPFNNHWAIIRYLRVQDLEENPHDDFLEDSGNNDAFDDLDTDKDSFWNDDAGN